MIGLISVAVAALIGATPFVADNEMDRLIFSGAAERFPGQFSLINNAPFSSKDVAVRDVPRHLKFHVACHQGNDLIRCQVIRNQSAREGNLLTSTQVIHADPRSKLYLGISDWNADRTDYAFALLNLPGWGLAAVYHFYPGGKGFAFDDPRNEYFIDRKISPQLPLARFSRDLFSGPASFRSVLGVASGLLSPVGGAARGPKGEAPDHQTYYAQPPCSISRGAGSICGLPLSAKVGASVVLTAFAAWVFNVGAGLWWRDDWRRHLCTAGGLAAIGAAGLIGLL